MHTPRGEVRFYKDEQGLPYIDLEESSDLATVMLLELVDDHSEEERESATALVQTVRENYEGFTRREVLQAKEARRAQVMLGNPSEKDYKGMVSNNLIANCPVSTRFSGQISRACEEKPSDEHQHQWWETM